MNNNYQKLTKELGPDRILLNEPMSKHTYFHLGGPADLFYTAKSTDELIKALKAAQKNNVPYFVLGNGSNILAGDLGIRGIVIKNEAKKIWHTGHYLTAESGALLNQIVNYANQRGLKGLANYFSIPGTLGGAIYNNSHGWPDRKELIGNLVSKALILDKDEKKTVNQEWFKFAYDNSKLQRHKAVLLEIVFKLKSEKPQKLKEISQEILRLRNQKQPIGENSSGCIFANPQGDSAGRLIDMTGLKGARIGGAYVSDKHANFIINDGTATVLDVLKLISLVKKQVQKQFKIILNPEVFLVGEFNTESQKVIKDINFQS